MWPLDHQKKHSPVSPAANPNSCSSRWASHAFVIMSSYCPILSTTMLLLVMVTIILDLISHYSVESYLSHALYHCISWVPVTYDILCMSVSLFCFISIRVWGGIYVRAIWTLCVCHDTPVGRFSLAVVPHPCLPSSTFLMSHCFSIFSGIHPFLSFRLCVYTPWEPSP